MCNPPFYENQEQYEKGVESKITSSHSVLISFPFVIKSLEKI